MQSYNRTPTRSSIYQLMFVWLPFMALVSSCGSTGANDTSITTMDNSGSLYLGRWQHESHTTGGDRVLQITRDGDMFRVEQTNKRGRNIATYMGELKDAKLVLNDKLCGDVVYSETSGTILFCRDEYTHIGGGTTVASAELNVADNEAMSKDELIGALVGRWQFTARIKRGRMKEDHRQGSYLQIASDGQVAFFENDKEKMKGMLEVSEAGQASVLFSHEGQSYTMKIMLKQGKLYWYEGATEEDDINIFEKTN